jgi:ketosteroid isomerase-like protein
MKCPRALLLTVAFVGVLAGPVFCADPSAEMKAAAAEIATAFANADVEAITKAYAEDAAIFPPNEARVDGRANIGKYWKAGFDAGVSDVKLTTTEIDAASDWAYEVGEYSFSAPDNNGVKMIGTGKFVVVWKKSAETWQLYRDIWNDNPAK